MYTHNWSVNLSRPSPVMEKKSKWRLERDDCKFYSISSPKGKNIIVGTNNKGKFSWTKLKSCQKKGFTPHYAGFSNYTCIKGKNIQFTTRASATQHATRRYYRARITTTMWSLCEETCHAGLDEDSRQFLHMLQEAKMSVTQHPDQYIKFKSTSKKLREYFNADILSPEDFSWFSL